MATTGSEFKFAKEEENECTLATLFLQVLLRPEKCIFNYNYKAS